MEFEGVGNVLKMENLKLYVLLTLAILLVCSIFPPSYQKVAIMFLIFATLSLAWVVVFKMGYVSFGTAAFYGAGAYIFVYLSKILGIPYTESVVATGASVMVLALVIGYVTLRLSGIFFIFVTFAAAEALRQIFTYYEVNYWGSVGRVIQHPLPTIHTLSALSLVLFFAALLFYLTTRPKYRLIIDFIRHDEDLARCCGVGTTRYKIVLFTLASAIQGVTGSIAAWYLAYIDPDIVFSSGVSLQTLVIGLLGEAGGFVGVILAAAFITFLSDQLVRVASHIHLLLMGILIIFVSKYRVYILRKKGGG